MANGYVTFVISIAFIGACTAIIGDVAGHLGCFINLKDGVNAIAFVALGTSVPGTNSVPRVVPEACYISYIVASLSCLTVRFVPKKVSFTQYDREEVIGIMIQSGIKLYLISTHF